MYPDEVNLMSLEAFGKPGDKFELGGKTFTNITGEGVREYILANKSFLQIPNPIGLGISESGAHCIFNADRAWHIDVKEGWSISWTRRVYVEIDESEPPGSKKEKVVSIADPFVI